ncbi:hypothetical protein [Streptomyces sp. NPDC007264]|uniref:hypothetical protein n=1 Tax=Streptomyces sp. NPDC007264 TaxID=3364777 RepID=UPI0036D94E92
MSVIVNEREARRMGRDFLAGRCTCPTCERYARTYYPTAFAEWCEANDQPVPEDVAAVLAAEEPPLDAGPGLAVLGVDLGKRTDHSAVALLLPGASGLFFHSVTRLPLATGAEAGGHYMTQARRLSAAVGKVLEKVGNVLVLVDATGIGDAVVEMVAAALPQDPRVQLVSVVITGGREAKHRMGRWTVAKTALIDPMVAALEQGEVTFGPFRDAAVVRRELLAYRVKASSVEAGPERLEAERQSDHDDCVIACALAVYAARNHRPMRVRAPMRTVPRAGAAGAYRRKLTR